MRDAAIREWLRQLTNSLGDPRMPVDAKEIEALYREQDYNGMLLTVKKQLRLNMRLVLGLVNNETDGPLTRTGTRPPAWTTWPEDLPPFWDPRFKDALVTVYIRRSFIADVPASRLTIAMAHELSHIVLEALRHPLRKVEEAVDLTAMLLGYRQLVAKHAVRVRHTSGWKEEPYEAIRAGRAPKWVDTTHTDILGYLSQEEIRYALTLMRT